MKHSFTSHRNHVSRKILWILFLITAAMLFMVQKGWASGTLAAPVLQSQMPSHQQEFVDPDQNLILTFDRDIQLGINGVTKRIIIRNAGTGSIFQNIALTAGNISGGTLTVSHDLLEQDKSYYIILEAGVISDVETNTSFGGFTQSTDWTFTTHDFVSIPDENLVDALFAHDPVIDTNDDGEISYSEAEAVTGDLMIVNLPISNSTGIEAFTNITRLWFQNTDITSLDISNNQSLVNAFLNGNQLSSVVAGNLPSLEILALNGNQLTSVDVSQLPALEVLWTYSNSNLATIDVSQNPNLTHLNTHSCSLSSIDVSNNPQLIELNITFNEIPELDVSNNIELQYLVAASTGLQELDLRAHQDLIRLRVQNNALSTLMLNNGNNENITDSNFNISGNSGLTCVLVDDADYAANTWSNVDEGLTFSDTYCDLNDIVYIPDENFKAALVVDNSINTNEDMEISFAEADAVESLILENQGIVDLTGLEAFSNLTFLWLTSNNIISADLTPNTLLETAVINSNFGLTSVNVNGLTELTNLQVKGGDLTALDVTTNTKLTTLEFFQNDISEIDITNNTDLRNVNFSFNDLTELDVSNNLELRTLNFWNNQVSTPLDISQHPHITTIQFSNNQISEVNLANGFNQNITLINGAGNPATCVKVDDQAYSETEWAHKFNEEVNFSDTYCDLNDIVNIPDENFKAALLSHNPVIDTNSDMEISYGEAQAFTGFLNMSSKAISDATGIEAFTGVTVLHFTSNDLTSIDLSQNTALTFLAVNGNALSSLDLSNNSLLTGVFANTNELESIDLSNNALIKDLLVQQNQLTTLDVSNITVLERLLATDNLITTFDLRSNPNIDEFKINDNSLTSLYLNNGNPENIFNFDISGNAELSCALVDDAEYSTLNWTNVDEGLIFSDTYCDPTDPVYIPDAIFKAALVEDNSINTNEDNEISFGEAEAFTGTIMVNSGTQGVVSDMTGVEAFVNLEVITMINHDISEFDPSNHPNLRNLILPNNELTEIDITTNPALTFVNLQSNQISEIDVSNNPNIRDLKLSYNQLTEIDISSVPLLIELTVGSNQLSEIDVTNNPDLQILFAFDNTISALDISQNTALRYLNVANTDLTSLDVSASPNLLEISANSAELTSVNLQNGANTELNALNLINNFNLTCVQVDDAAYSEANWSEAIDEGVGFSEDCNVVEFVDANFEAALVSDNSINTNEDDFIQLSEANVFSGRIVASSQGVSDLSGIEAFTNVTEIFVHSNNITSADFSDNPNLEWLAINNNQLTSLNVSANAMLVDLRCYNNSLTSLDISNNTLVSTLWVANNNLTELDVRNNPELSDVWTSGGNSFSTVDLSKNPKLFKLLMADNQLEALDLSENGALTDLRISNNNLSTLDVRNGSNDLIANFEAEGNQLSCISVSDIAFAEANWTMIDNGVIFSTDCSNDATDIIAFSISEQSGSATIDATNHTVMIEVVNGTSLTSLEPTISISDGATISPEGAQDFSNPVTYTVTAENFETQDWTVTVTEKELTLGTSDLQSLNIYPNPTTSFITLEGINQSFSARVLDLQGQELLKSSNETELNLSNLSAGMYLLHIKLADGSSKTIRISKDN